MRKTRSTRNSKNKFHWNKVQRFSIRKFSFGVASCMIGAQFVLSGLPKVVDAAMVTTRNDKGVVTLYANRGESPYDAAAIAVHDSINVDREIVVDVDWSSYSKTNPYVTVTYKYNGGFGASNYVANYGGSRPHYWFTTPVGAQEPSEIRLQTGTTDRVMKSWSSDSPWVSLTNTVGSRYQTKEQVDSMGLGDDTKWERYNDTTQETGKTYLGDLAGMFNYRIGTQISDSPSDQGIFESFRTNTKSIYSDWDLARNDRVTITAKYKVADPTLKNGRRTLDFGAGVRVGRALQQLRHFKVVTTEIPVLYQDKELFEPALPERIGVVDTAKLTAEEKTLLKNKIWEKNQATKSDAIPEHSHNKFIENVKEGDDGIASADSSISIADDGTATITYGDGTQDVIPGTSLVYEKPQIDNIETTPANVGDYKYLKNPHAVDNINSLTGSDIASARQKFFQVNGMTTTKNEDGDDVIQSVGDASKTSSDFVGTNLEYDPRSQGFAVLRNSMPVGITIPKADLFKAKPTKVFSAAEAIEKGKQAIDNLTYLSPKEKENYKNQLTGKTTQDDINNVVNAAIAKNSENEKAIEAKKRQVKDKINSAKYLTEAEKEAFRKQVDNQGIEDPANGNGTGTQAADYTKELLDKIGQQADAKNLENAKKSTKEKIDQIKDSLKSPTADEYKTQIDGKTTVAEVEKVLEEAEKQKSKNEAQKAQEEAEKLKEEYKKQIDQIPGLSEADKEEYKKQIDQAKSKDQLETILNDAKAQASREKAKQIIENLPHLNKAQKDELKAKVENASDKNEIDGIVSIAQGLDSKMDSLQKLVAEAEKVKNSDKYNTADQDKKTAFDKAKDAASKVADKTTTAPENAADTTEVTALIDKLAKAIEELTGKKVAVPVSKDALKAELDLNKDDAVKKSPAYAKETDAAKKKAYDDALVNAQKVYNNPDATQPQVDEALDKLQQAHLALSGKAEDFTLAVTETAKISKEPKAGESLTEQADKDAVKAKVTANGKALDDTYTVEYGTIADKNGKKVVPITVIHDGVAKTIDVPVEGTDAAKSPLNDSEKVKVNNVANLSDDEKEAVKAAVKKANTNLTDDQISVDSTGKVTVTYSDKSQNELPASKTVEAKTEAEKALDKAKEKAKADLTEAANKEKEEIEADTKLSKDEKAKAKAEVDKVKKEQEAKIDGATTPEKVAEATEAGKKAIDAVHKTELDKAKDKAKADLTEAANKEKEEIEADKNLTDQQKADKKAEVDKVKKAQEANIDKAQTTDKVAKATEEGKKAIDAVHKTELDKAKDKAKADLTEAANKEKAEIEADKNLTDQQKADKKAEVDNVKKAQEANIDNATTPEEVAKATEDGKKAIDAVHKTELDKAKEKAKADLTAAANKEKEEIEADKNLTDQQKADKKAEVDKVKKEQEANIDKAQTTDEVAKATEEGKKAIDKVHQTDLEKAKDKAKADLTKAAEEEKKEIDADNGLTKSEKEALKQKVDEVKKAQEANIDKANTPEEVASATTNGKQAIAGVHTPTDIKEYSKELNKPENKVKVTDTNHLTDEEKSKVKEAVVKANPGLSKDDITVDDKGNVTTPKGFLLPKDVITQALNKPATPVVVADPNHLTDEEKEAVKKAVADANPGLNKDNITVDDKGNVTTKNGDKLLAKDVVTPALKKPTTPVVVGNPNALTDKEKEDIKNAVVAENPGLNKGDVTVNPDGSVTTPKGNLPKEDVVTTVLNKPNKLVEVENPNSLTVKEKEAVKKAVAEANPGLTEDKIKVDDQGNVTTPKGNLPAKDVVTSKLKKPTTPVEVKNPNNLTDKEKEDVKNAVSEANPGLDKKDIKVDDQGNVETPKGNLPAGDVVVPALKKPTTPVVVKNPDQLTNEEKEAIKDAIVAVNPDLADKKDKIKVDNQGNVETPKGNLPKEDVVTIVLNKPTAPVVVKNPDSLTDEEKDKVKDAVAKANPGLDKKDIKVDNQGNVETPNGGLPAKDVITSDLKKPTTPVEVKDPNKLTDEEKDKVKDEVAKANPGLDKKDIKVDNQGNVETPKGNLPAGDVVTPVLNVPTKPIVIGNPESLTEKEKEAVKDAVAEANPGLDKKDITVDNQGNVETPKGNLPTEYIVKVSKGESVIRPALPELSIQDALVAGEVAVEKGKDLTNEDILKQLTLVEGVTAKVTKKPTTTETGTKEAEVEVTLADGTKVTVKVPVKVYEGERPEVNDLAKAKEDAKKRVEEAANKKIDEIKKRTDLSEDEKKAATDKVNKAKDDANTQIDNATSSGTAKVIGDAAAENIKNYNPKATPAEDVKPVDPSKLDEEKAKAITEIEQTVKDQTDAIKNNKDLTQGQKDKAIKEIEALKAKAIEDVRKADSVDKVKDIVEKVKSKIKDVNPQPYRPTPYPGNSGNGTTRPSDAQANSEALENARKAAENILAEAERAKKAQLEEAGLSDAEKADLFAKVESEKQAALDEIAKAKDVDTVKQLVTKAVAKIKAIQPARNAQDNQDSQDAQNAQNAQDTQNLSNSNPTSLDAANVRGQELPATGTGSEFVVFNAAAISILTGLGLAIPSKKKETEK